MQDKEMVVKGLEWIINHKGMLYGRIKDFDDKELGLLDKTSLLLDRVLIISKSNKWAAIPQMLEILYNHLSACWDYMTDDEWKRLMDKIVTGLSEWKEAVESEDTEYLYESMINTISYSGDALVEMMFSSKRKTTPEEWEIEKTLDERIEKVGRGVAVLEDKLTKQEDINESLFDYIAKIENDIAEIKGRITE